MRITSSLRADIIFGKDNGLKKEAVITPQIAVVLPLTLVLLIATLVLVSLAMRE